MITTVAVAIKLHGKVLIKFFFAKKIFWLTATKKLPGSNRNCRHELKFKINWPFIPNVCFRSIIQNNAFGSI